MTRPAGAMGQREEHYNRGESITTEGRALTVTQHCKLAPNHRSTYDQTSRSYGNDRGESITTEGRALTVTHYM